MDRTKLTRVGSLTLLLAALLLGPILVHFNAEALARDSLNKQPVVGQTEEFVLRTLGPPDSIEASPQLQVWAYKDTAAFGYYHVMFHSGISVSVETNLKSPPDPREIPDMGPYVGQGVAELVAQQGPAKDQSLSALNLELQYEHQTITIANGRVIQVH